MPTQRLCFKLFRVVDWAQVCGIDRVHSAGRLSLQDDEGLVTSICLAAAIRVAANGAVVVCVEEETRCLSRNDRQAWAVAQQRRFAEFG